MAPCGCLHRDKLQFQFGHTPSYTECLTSAMAMPTIVLRVATPFGRCLSTSWTEETIQHLMNAYQVAIWCLLAQTFTRGHSSRDCLTTTLTGHNLENNTPTFCRIIKNFAPILRASFNQEFFFIRDPFSRIPQCGS